MNGWKVHTDINHTCAACPTHVAFAYGENEFMLLQMKGLVWGMGQALLRSPRGRNASRDGLVKLGWVHCLQYTLNRFQDNVCGLCRCEPSNYFFCIYIFLTNFLIFFKEEACIIKTIVIKWLLLRLIITQQSNQEIRKRELK